MKRQSNAYLPGLSLYNLSLLALAQSTSIIPDVDEQDNYEDREGDEIYPYAGATRISNDIWVHAHEYGSRETETPHHSNQGAYGKCHTANPLTWRNGL